MDNKIQDAAGNSAWERIKRFVGLPSDTAQSRISPLSLTETENSTRRQGLRKVPAQGVSTVGSRVSQSADDYGGSMQSFAVFSSSSYWRDFALADNISLRDLSRVPIHKVAELLSQVSPEVSQGLYIRTIFSNSGFEFRAMQLNGEETDERAQAELDKMRAKIREYNGTEDVFFNRLFMSLFLRGSILAELILDPRGREFVDIATPDTRTLMYKRISDPLRGTIWDFGQIQNGNFVSLRLPTVRYVPLNPFPDSMEGQPLISSAFFIAVFMMAVLRDFKRVVQQQGYPRYDIEIDLEKMKNLMPEGAEDDEKIFQEWAEKIRDSIKGYIKDLEPDETFIHYTGITVNQPVGAMGTNSLSAIDGLFKVMERIAARAMKVPPLLLGITDGVSEANSNRQFEGFLKDIQNGQHAVETCVGEIYQLGLQAKGIACRVQLRFAELRSSERLRDVQAEQLEATVAQLQYNAGWISQDEAARRGAKVKKADQQEPRQAAAPTNPTEPDAAGGGNPNRTFERMPTAGDVEKAKAIFAEYAPPNAAGIIIAEGEY